MELRLIRSSLLPIERIRGEDLISVIVECNFINSTGKIYTVSGISLCKSAGEIEKAYLKAVENARENVKLLDIKETMSTTGNTEVIGELLRQTIASDVAVKVRKEATSRTTYDEMNSLAGEHLQIKIDQLCEALGIVHIDITKWTNVEALVLISSLEKMAQPLAEGV